MPTFNTPMLTDIGERMLADVNSGHTNLHYTKAVFSSMDNTNKSDDDLKKIDDLSSYDIQTNTYANLKNDNTVELRAIGSNKGLTQGANINTYAIYGQAGSIAGEHLFAIAVTQTPDYLPADNGKAITNLTFSVLFKTQHAQSINFSDPHDEQPTYQDISDLNNRVDGIQGTINDTLKPYDQRISQNANDINTLKQNKVDNSDFNSYKDSTNKQINSVQDNVNNGVQKNIDSINQALNGKVDSRDFDYLSNNLDSMAQTKADATDVSDKFSKVYNKFDTDASIKTAMNQANGHSDDNYKDLSNKIDSHFAIGEIKNGYNLNNYTWDGSFYLNGVDIDTLIGNDGIAAGYKGFYGKMLVDSRNGYIIQVLYDNTNNMWYRYVGNGVTWNHVAKQSDINNIKNEFSNKADDLSSQINENFKKDNSRMDYLGSTKYDKSETYNKGEIDNNINSRIDDFKGKHFGEGTIQNGNNLDGYTWNGSFVLGGVNLATLGGNTGLPQNYNGFYGILKVDTYSGFTRQFLYDNIGNQWYKYLGNGTPWRQIPTTDDLASIKSHSWRELNVDGVYTSSHMLCKISEDNTKAQLIGVLGTNTTSYNTVTIHPPEGYRFNDGTYDMMKSVTLTGNNGNLTVGMTWGQISSTFNGYTVYGGGWSNGTDIIIPVTKVS